MSNAFRAGEKAPCSGLYKAIHTVHSEAHQIIVLYGDAFPACLQCGTAVKFELTESSVYVYAHSLFARDR
jgi:hypothetical protein